MISHEEVMYKIDKIPKAKIGDYISIAIANGMEEISVVENLSNLYEKNTGVYQWNKIYELVKKFKNDYSIKRSD